MKLFQQFAILLFFAGISSCGSDESEPLQHEIGSWELEDYNLINVPDEYSSNEGARLELRDILLGTPGQVLDSYEIELKSNGEFERILRLEYQSFVDRGTWTIDDENLKMESVIKIADVNSEFGIISNADDRLSISRRRDYDLIKDAILDTLTTEYVETLEFWEYNNLYDKVTLDVVHNFRRVE